MSVYRLLFQNYKQIDDDCELIRLLLTIKGTFPAPQATSMILASLGRLRERKVSHKVSG